ncbi:MAG: hypothetical protein CFE46_11660 [Burkholderiales bacterium PBB6]|nr:MAG: hypothetical protein CFE46_11660 [Burkholderiales bacterium PBB6]
MTPSEEHTRTDTDGAAPHEAPRVPVWLQSRSVPWVGLVLSMVIAAGAAAFLVFERGEINEEATSRAELYARVLEDHANRSMGSVELIMQTAEATVEGRGAGGKGAEALNQMLEEAVRGQPMVRSLNWLDTRGLVVASSNPRNVGLDTRVLIDLPDTGLGKVTPGRDLHLMVADGALLPTAPGVVVLPFARPTRQPDGRLLALVNLDFFANQYQLTLSDSPSRAALLSYAGQLITATEGIEAPGGQMVRQLPIYERFLPKLELGSYTGAGIDGEAAITAFRTTRRYPLVIAVETPVSSVNDRLYALGLQVASAAGMTMLVVAALTLLAWRSLRSRELTDSALTQTKGTLADQGLFTDGLFEASPVPMSVKDREGRYLRVNRAWTRFLGVEAGDVLGRSNDLMLRLVDAEHLMGMEQSAMALGQPVQYEAQITDAGGQLRDVAMRLMPYRDAADNVRGVISCWLDVTEFREAERRTLDAKNAAERSNQAKSEFIANMSHELRTPLQSILGYSELGVDRTANGDSKLHRMFSSIHGGGVRMLALVNNLLDLSRVSTAVGDFERRPIDLVPALVSVIDELAPLAAGRNVEVVSKGHGAPLPALADPIRMQQVLRNVLANAIRFAPAGTAVEVDWRFEHDAVDRITVSDRGPGIPPEELESIFEAFVQSTRTKDGSGGTGLGLAICRKIMDSHAGSIVAHNRPDGGAVFEIRLPRLQTPLGESD